MKLDGHAVRISGVGPVRQVRYARRIGKSYCHRNGAAAEYRRPAQGRCLGGRLEAAFGDNTLGVIGPEPWMHAKSLVRGVDELFLEGAIFSSHDPGPRQSKHDHRNKKLVVFHGCALLGLASAHVRAEPATRFAMTFGREGPPKMTDANKGPTIWVARWAIQRTSARVLARPLYVL